MADAIGTSSVTQLSAPVTTSLLQGQATTTMGVAPPDSPLWTEWMEEEALRISVCCSDESIADSPSETEAVSFSGNGTQIFRPAIIQEVQAKVTSHKVVRKSINDVPVIQKQLMERVFEVPQTQTVARVESDFLENGMQHLCQDIWEGAAFRQQVAERLTLECLEAQHTLALAESQAYAKVAEKTELKHRMSRQ